MYWHLKRYHSTLRLNDFQIAVLIPSAPKPYQRYLVSSKQRHPLIISRPLSLPQISLSWIWRHQGRNKYHWLKGTNQMRGHYRAKLFAKRVRLFGWQQCRQTVQLQTRVDELQHGNSARHDSRGTCYLRLQFLRYRSLVYKFVDQSNTLQT